MYECVYCETKYLTEKQYDKHTCRERERLEVLETRVGKLAYKHYTTWFSKKRIPTRKPTKRTFIGSQFYNPFLTFTEFVNKMGIPDTDMYIELMVDKNVLPQHWYHPDIYGVFIDYMDEECPMIVHTRITLSTLDKLSAAFECKIGEVFSRLRTGDMVKLIQSRNISPWVLLLSSEFKNFAARCTSQERSVLEEAMNLKRWKMVIRKNQTLIPETRELLTQLGL